VAVNFEKIEKMAE